MKILKTLLFFFLVIPFCHGQETSVAPTTVVITISGMACQEGCADTIKNSIDQLQGVVTSEVSFVKGKAKIIYDATKIPIDSLTRRIKTTKVKNYTYDIKRIEFKE